MSKHVRAQYTFEFRQETVRLAQSEASAAAAARSLAIGREGSNQTLNSHSRSSTVPSAAQLQGDFNTEMKLPGGDVMFDLADSAFSHPLVADLKSIT